MNRYLQIILAIMAVSLVLTIAAVSWLFSATLGQARADAEKRMHGIAAYCAAGVDSMARSGRDDDGIGAWLGALGAAVGVERIVVIDSLGSVYWSGSSQLSRGDDIAPYVIDSASYERARIMRREAVSPLVRIDGIPFQALYHPCRIAGEAMTVMVQSDQNYLSASRRFRNNVVVILVLLAVLLALQAVALFLLDRRAAQADRRLRSSERLAFLGRMSAELAHELKNPLAIIKSSADVLRIRYDPDKTAAPFTFLSDEIMRLSRLITDMLGFSRDRPFAQDWIGVAGFLDEFSESRTAMLQQTRLVHSIDGCLRIKGDRDALLQIFDNLVRNAVQAMNGAGEIRISTERAAKSLHLLVSDTGPGIPAEIGKHLFEPFVSGSKTGTGLGLAIVQTLCEQSGLRIGVRSGPSTCFYITIREGLWQESSL